LYDKVNIKSVIIVTSLATVVSVAAGGIGGVTAGTLLIRALLFALLFAVGTALINIVVDTYLPELKTKADSRVDESAEGENERGQNVNIVMEDENGPATMPGASEEQGVTASGSDTDRAFSKGDAEGAGPIQHTGIEGIPSSNGALPDIGVFSSNGDDDDDDNVSETIDSANATESPLVEGVRSKFGSMQTNDEDKKEFFQNNTTAEELAKGVRTMLKSDEKG
jgi:hypothetical protein